MNLLLCTNRNPHFPTITEYIENAVGAIGHRCTFFDDRNFLLPGRIHRRLPLLRTWDLLLMNRRLYRYAAAVQPDLCLVAGGTRILPATIRSLGGLGIRTVLWTIDAPTNFTPIITAAPHYDHIFCGGSEAVDLLASAGLAATWLPFGCDPDSHFPAPPEGHGPAGNNRIAFVGSYYPNRLTALSALLDYNLEVWGPGWERIPHDHPLNKKVHPGQIHPDQWRRIYSGAAMVIVIHFHDHRIPCYQASPKLFEALACGAFVLADAQPDALQLLTPGRHFAVFHDQAELRSQVDHYLAHPDQRQRIATQGRHETLARHCYHHRLRALLTRVTGEEQ